MKLFPLSRRAMAKTNALLIIKTINTITKTIFFQTLKF